jgi:hypothetical protein
LGSRQCSYLVNFDWVDHGWRPVVTGSAKTIRNPINTGGPIPPQANLWVNMTGSAYMSCRYYSVILPGWPMLSCLISIVDKVSEMVCVLFFLPLAFADNYGTFTGSWLSFMNSIMRAVSDTMCVCFFLLPLAFTDDYGTFTVSWRIRSCMQLVKWCVFFFVLPLAFSDDYGRFTPPGPSSMNSIVHVFIEKVSVFVFLLLLAFTDKFFLLLTHRIVFNHTGKQ